MNHGIESKKVISNSCVGCVFVITVSIYPLSLMPPTAYLSVKIQDESSVLLTFQLYLKSIVRGRVNCLKGKTKENKRKQKKKRKEKKKKTNWYLQKCAQKHLLLRQLSLVVEWHFLYLPLKARLLKKTSCTFCDLFQKTLRMQILFFFFFFFLVSFAFRFSHFSSCAKP